MLTRQSGRNYIYKTEYDVPTAINKKKTDEALQKLYTHFNAIREELKELYDYNYDIYKLIDEVVFSYACLDVDDGKCWKISCTADEIENLQEKLKTSDEIPEIDDILTLKDIGYRQESPFEKEWWTKILEDTDEKEIVEEIILKDTPIRRERKTIWEKTDYGKSSKEINYKTLKISKKLMKAIENTKKEIAEKSEEN